jgi:hypothetical protein
VANSAQGVGAYKNTFYPIDLFILAETSCTGNVMKGFVVNPARRGNGTMISNPFDDGELRVALQSNVVLSEMGFMRTGPAEGWCRWGGRMEENAH